MLCPMYCVGVKYTWPGLWPQSTQPLLNSFLEAIYSFLFVFNCNYMYWPNVCHSQDVSLCEVLPMLGQICATPTWQLDYLWPSIEWDIHCLIGTLSPQIGLHPSSISDRCWPHTDRQAWSKYNIHFHVMCWIAKYIFTRMIIG